MKPGVEQRHHAGNFKTSLHPVKRSNCRLHF